MEPHERLLALIESEGLNAKSFASKIGVTHSVIYHVIGEGTSNRRNLPGYQTLVKIAFAFPTLNIRWLLTGEGDMTDPACKVENEKEKSSASGVVDQNEEGSLIDKLMKLIDLKTETITTQNETITVQGGIIADLQSKIRHLDREK